jgi:alpha-glucosidase
MNTKDTINTKEISCMNILRSTVLACVLFIAPLMVASDGWLPLGDVSSVHESPQGVELTVGQAHVRITSLSPNIVRLRYTPQGSFPDEPSFAVLPNAFPTAPQVRIDQSSDEISLDTGTLRLKIQKTPLRIVFLDLKGEVISQDQSGYPVAFNRSAFRVWKSMPEDEHYFGLGDKSGPLDHRNLAFTMWNTDAFGWQESTDPLYKSIPFFLAMRGGRAYGIFLDNTYRSSFDFGKASRDF